MCSVRTVYIVASEVFVIASKMRNTALTLPTEGFFEPLFIMNTLHRQEARVWRLDGGESWFCLLAC